MKSGGPCCIDHSRGVHDLWDPIERSDASETASLAVLTFDQ